MEEIRIRQAKLYDVPAMARIERDSFGDIMYELPSRPEVEKCIITADVVNGEAEPVLFIKGEAKESKQLKTEKEA